MYYNIKIITKDSELGLESEDRTIIEREMDIYFARIYGASDEFTSRIKVIEVNKPELKSINEIEHLIDTIEAPTVAPIITEAPTVAPIITEAPTVVPVITEAPTVAPIITEAPTVAPIITEAPTVAPIVTQAPTVTPVITEVPTVAPITTEAPTVAPVITEAPTVAPIVDNRGIDNQEILRQTEITKEIVGQAMQSASSELLKNSYNKINESKINDIFFNEPKTKEVIRSTQDDELSQVTGSYLDSFVEFHPMNDKKELEKEAQALFEELQAQVKAEENNNTQDQVIQPQIQKENEVVKQQSSIQYISETIRANEPKKPTPFQDIIDAYNEQRDPQGDSDDLIDLNELAKSSQAQSDENEIQVSEPPEEVTFILSENPKQMPDNTDDDTPEISEAIEIQHEENNIEPMQVQNNAIENLQENVVQEEPQEQNVQNNEETKQETQPEKQGFSIDAELEPPKVPGLSFSMFLSGFATDEIHDEFMICAFYIKNILRQHDFTMKYINSKLFQATGKIADTSIVDELIEKEYIKIIMTDDFTKYSIAPKGEEYLINKLQN